MACWTWPCPMMAILKSSPPTMAIIRASNLICICRNKKELMHQPWCSFMVEAGQEEARTTTVLIPDYRVYPEHLFPDFIVDGADALAWLEREGFADRGIVLMGHSAGAHIAAMLAYNPSYLEASGLDHKLITALIGYAGPYDDFDLSSRKLQRIFAPADPLAVSHPINFVDQNSPVSLLIHGLSDSTVVVNHSQNLADKLRAHGVVAKTRFYNDNGHVAVVASLALPLRHWTPAFADTLDFLAELSKEPSLSSSASTNPPPRKGTVFKQP